MTRFPRSVATTVLSAMLVGLLLPATARGQAPPSAPATPASPQSPRSEADGDGVGASRPVDGYTVGAAALNVLWVPFKVAECGIMSGFAVLGFIFTLGAGRDWSASALEEGCVHKRRIQGDDRRPPPPHAPPGERARSPRGPSRGEGNSRFSPRSARTVSDSRSHSRWHTMWVWT